MFIQRERCSIRHSRSELGTKILDNDFLDVAVRLVKLAERQQRLYAFTAGLTDPDQDARRKRNALLPAIRIASRRAAGSLSGEP